MPPADSVAEPEPATDAPTSAVTGPEAWIGTPGQQTGDPFQAAVGESGWAIHVYSLSDSNRVWRQIASLQQLGIQADWRLLEIPDRGRWYRIYVGSFASRAEATAALPALKERLGIDWAMPARFQ